MHSFALGSLRNLSLITLLFTSIATGSDKSDLPSTFKGKPLVEFNDTTRFFTKPIKSGFFLHCVVKIRASDACLPSILMRLDGSLVPQEIAADVGCRSVFDKVAKHVAKGKAIIAAPNEQKKVSLFPGHCAVEGRVRFKD